MNALIFAIFATLAVASALPHLPSPHLGVPINPLALSPIGPSGIVSGQGATGPSGIVTGSAAVGPSGIVTGLGPIGPNGPAGHGPILPPGLSHAAPFLPLVPGLGLSSPLLGHPASLLHLGAPGLGLIPPHLPLGLAAKGLTLQYGLGLPHGIH